jgi:hypothetical protein
LGKLEKQRNAKCGYVMKRCGKCKIEKDESEFSRDKSRKDGLQCKCKRCDKEYSLIPENKERKNEYQKEYYLIPKNNEHRKE